MHQVFASPAWLKRLAGVLGGSLALNLHLRASELVAELAAEPSRRSRAELEASMLGRVGAGRGAADWTGAGRPRGGGPAAAGEQGRATAHRRPRPQSSRSSSHRGRGGRRPRRARRRGDGPGAGGGAQPGARPRAGTAGGARHERCGARELNYLSDIDVVYVAEPATDDVPVADALQVATRLVAASARVCSGHSAAGTIWQVDTALRIPTATRARWCVRWSSPTRNGRRTGSSRRC